MRPFGQVNGGWTRRHEGTGLGLPISLALARLHGGDMQLHSTKGLGTRVAIDLPVSASFTRRRARARDRKRPMKQRAMERLMGVRGEDPPDRFARLGRIVAVTGGHAILLLDNGDGLPGGAPVKSPEIGTLLKVDTAPSIALALVSALSAPMPSNSDGDQELRIVEVEFIGELPKDEAGAPQLFRRGISCYPSLGDVVSRASKDELAMAYACDAESSIRIGAIQQDSSIPAMVKIDELLGKHFAVLGTTGTGKSCAVALILRRILEKNPQAHILLLDLHREYAASFREYAELVQPDSMNLPFWLLNFDEIVEILIGVHPSRETDIEILRELIPVAKQRYMSNARRDLKAGSIRQRDETSTIGVDTPVPYRASDLMALLDEQLGRLEMKNDLAPY